MENEKNDLDSIEKRLNNLEKLTQENNKIIKRIDRRDKWASIWGIFKFIIFIGIPLYLWYYLSPYLQQLMDTYQSIQETSNSLGSVNIPSNINLQDLLDSFKGQ